MTWTRGGCSRPNKDAIVSVHDWRYAFMEDFISPIMGCLGVASCFVPVGRHDHQYIRDGLGWSNTAFETPLALVCHPCIDVALDPVSLCLPTLYTRLVFRSLSPFLPPSVFRYLVTRRAITHTTPWYAHSHQLIHTHAHALTRAPALSPSVWALARSLSMTRSHVRSCFVSVLYGSLPLSLSLSRSLAVSLSYFPMLTVSRSLSLVLYLLCRPRSWESPWESPCSIDKQKILMKNKKKRETHEEIPTHVEWQRKS